MDDSVVLLLGEISRSLLWFKELWDDVHNTYTHSMILKSDLYL